MKKVNHIGSLVCNLMVCFLFFAVISRALSIPYLHPDSKSFFISKKSEGPSKSDTQFLYEEKEGRSENDCNDERGDESQDNLFFICLVGEPLSHVVLEPQPHFLYGTRRPFGNATNIPLYLVKQVFLI